MPWSRSARASKARRSAGILWSVVTVGLTVGCGTEPKPEPEVPTVAPKPKERSKAPAVMYETGMIAPDIWAKRVNQLKPKWTECYLTHHEKQETLEGKFTLTMRTVRDGTVKWAYLKDSTLGSRAVEKCVLDLVRDTNFGPPMDAKEGELEGFTFGWQLDEETRPADPGKSDAVLPSLLKAKKKLDECRAGKPFHATATVYVAPHGKPLSAGVSVDAAEGEAAADCMVSVMMGLRYVNKSGWPIKVSVSIP